MKVKKVETKEKFTLFDLVFTITSKEEARAMYAIFNHGHNTRLLKDSGEMVKDIIGRKYYVEYDNEEIANGVTYKEFYK